MEIAALAVSIGSVVWAVVGTYLSNKRANEANERAEKAAEAALWSRSQEAIQRLLGFDPASEPVGPRLQDLRIASIDLVDGLVDWLGLDEWLEAERSLGAVLGRQVMDRASPNDTVDQRLATLDPYMRWAQALSSNLRLFRREGYNAKAAEKLREHAERLTAEVYAANGWEVPDRSGFEALDLGDE